MKSGDDRGFTLLEMLVALSIVSLLMVALLGAFSFGETVLRHTRVERDLMRQLVVAQNVLSRMLAELPASPLQTVSGSIDHLAFYAYPPRAMGSSEPARTTVRFDHHEKRLILVWQLTEPVLRAVEQELLPAAAEARFAYFSSAEGWSSAWQSGRPPELVRMEILTSTGSRRELVLATKSVNEPQCLSRGSCSALQR